VTTKNDSAPISGRREQKRALGRGLSALIPNSARPDAPQTLERAIAPDGEPLTSGLLQIPLLKIALNPYQPRKSFSADSLLELTESIKQHGVLQPIVVRPKAKSTYELVAGERRFRAATNAGLKVIPAVVREMDDQTSLAVALIENIQRQELNPVESARAYERLIAEFGLTQSELASEVGKSQPSIANSLRLLGLPDEILESLSQSAISEGHAKVLLSIDDKKQMIDLWKIVVRGSLSVRETERRTADLKTVIPRRIAKTNLPGVKPDIEQAQLEDQLSLALGTKVQFRYSGREKGHIEIQFYDLEQLDGLLRVLTTKK
jgi:ParB family transcriptional regulator, chromosome partitioning protein